MTQNLEYSQCDGNLLLFREVYEIGAQYSQCYVIQIVTNVKKVSYIDDGLCMAPPPTMP